MSKKYQGIFVRLLPKQYNHLQILQKENGITFAEQIRIAVSRYIKEEKI